MVDPPHGQSAATFDPSGRATARALAPRRAGVETSGQPTKITFGFVLRAASRWWKLATPTALVLAAIAAVVMIMLYEPVYHATSWLRIEPPGGFVFDGMQSPSNSFAQTQAALVRSPLVLEQVMARPDVARIPDVANHPAPASYLANRVTVSSRSELFIVGYRCGDPDEAALIANAVVEAYFKMHSQDEAFRAQRIIDLLEDEKARRTVTYKQMQDQIKELKERSQGKQGDKWMMGDEQTLRQPIGDLHSELTKKDMQYQLVKAHLQAAEEQIRARGDVVVEDAAVDAKVMQNDDVIRLQTANEALQARMQQVLDTSIKLQQDPLYQQYEQQMAANQRELNDLLERLREAEKVKVADRMRKEEEEALKKLRQSKANLELHMELLRERFEEQRQELIAAGGRTLDVFFKKQDLDRERAVLSLISTKIMRMRTELRMPARVSLLRAAKPPGLAEKPLNLQLVSAAGVCAFLVPFGLAVLWERFVCRIDGPAQLWAADLAVVGEIAKLPVSGRGAGFGGAAAIGRDVSLFEESIDSLRTCLVLSDAGGQSRTLVVTSSISGEGKTSVACQLAVSIARSTGEPTLLIDADMRSPDVHNVFDIDNEPGLAQVLGGEATLDEAINTSWSNYVHVLPAGLLRTSPHKLLGDGRVREFLDAAAARYKHVIIDTSPILSASESLVLAKEADGTLLCAMRDVTRLDQVQRAYDRLVNTGARPLGTVLNGVPTNRYAYLYGVYSYGRE